MTQQLCECMRGERYLLDVLLVLFIPISLGNVLQEGYNIRCHQFFSKKGSHLAVIFEQGFGRRFCLQSENVSHSEGY